MLLDRTQVIDLCRLRIADCSDYKEEICKRTRKEIDKSLAEYYKMSWFKRWIFCDPNYFKMLKRTSDADIERRYDRNVEWLVSDYAHLSKLASLGQNTKNVVFYGEVGNNGHVLLPLRTVEKLSKDHVKSIELY